MELVIVNHSGRPVPRVFLVAWLKAAYRLLTEEVPASKFRGRELVIAFVSDEEIRRLNKTYRGKNYATDVLSFESDDPSSLGELVVSPAVISRQAREHGLLVREELGYMVLHGFLHLLGYDHEKSERDAKKMFAIQDRVFEKLLSSRKFRR